MVNYIDESARLICVLVYAESTRRIQLTMKAGFSVVIRIQAKETLCDVRPICHHYAHRLP